MQTLTCQGSITLKHTVTDLPITVQLHWTKILYNYYRHYYNYTIGHIVWHVL